MLNQITPNIYRITVDLPENPLRSLNSYVITGGSRSLLIDTGFNRPECLAALKSGIDELGLDMLKTDIFLTHMHADHSGLVPQVMSPQSRVFMSEVDFKIFSAILQQPESYWQPRERAFIMEGYPPRELERTLLRNPGRNFMASTVFACDTLRDGDELSYGASTLKCIATPGHTPGHMCLYDPEQQILFTGDHLLFDITPNITTWEGFPDPLCTYLESLNKIAQLPVKLALTGHRENSGSFKQRVTELLRHHAERLDEVKGIVAASPGINGYEVAARLKWSVRVKSWEDFPPGQRWFAVGEAVAHLIYLLNKGEIYANEAGGVNRYTVSEPH